MFGDGVNNLNVYLKSGNNLGRPVFQKHGNQGNQWKQAFINIRNKSNVKVSSIDVVVYGIHCQILLLQIIYPNCWGQYFSPNRCYASLHQHLRQSPSINTTLFTTIFIEWRNAHL